MIKMEIVCVKVLPPEAIDYHLKHISIWCLIRLISDSSLSTGEMLVWDVRSLIYIIWDILKTKKKEITVSTDIIFSEQNI